MDHPPRLFDQGLPSDRELNPADLSVLDPDPFWDYQLLGGALLVRPHERQLTSKDLESFPRFPHWKYELLEGTLIVSPNAPGLRHQDCVGSLFLLFRQACPAELKVVVAPFEFLPVPTVSLQPDLLIARRPVGLKRLTQAPVLVAEVLSLGTGLYDRTRKRDLYQGLGVEHYWIVDPAGPSIEALQLRSGVYTIAAKAEAGQVFEIEDPVPVRFDPRDLLDE